VTEVKGEKQVGIPQNRKTDTTKRLIGSSAIYEIPESTLQEQPALGSDSLSLELDTARSPHNTPKLSMTRIIRFAPHVLSAGRIANADLSNRSRWRPAFLLAVAAGKASTITLKKWLKIAISSRN
jgi:hypothetical protein